ncbi:hypothetical protein [Streptomyces sp. AC154]|uniref:hypothetical protein n=1 Tax=Streptomyces sp. AC154 TaxID=3143184 RepID=UPI003F7FF260
MSSDPHSRYFAEGSDLWSYVLTPTVNAISKIRKHQEQMSSQAAKLMEADRNGYKQLFGKTSGEMGSTAQYEYEDILGMRDLYRRVQDDPLVAQKFLLPQDREESPINVEKVFFHEVAMIPILLADMYIRGGGDIVEANKGDLEQLYRGLEKYLTTEDLRMHVYVPILGAGIHTEKHYPGFSIVRLSDQQRRQLAAIPHVHPRDSRILGSATHALEVKDVPALAGGCGMHFEVEPCEATFDLIDQFFDAASLESASHIGYAQMIFSPNGWFGNLDAQGVADYTYLCRDYPTRLDSLMRHPAHLEGNIFDRIHDHFDKLNRGHPSLRVAARRLTRALSRESDEDRIVDLCIGLEAILGGGSGSGEIVHKISMRAGAMLSRSGWGGSGNILISVKDIYSYRSKVVHGVPGPHKKQLIHVDGVPVHASRYALAALRQVLSTALQIEGFDPNEVDAVFVYSALDCTAAERK